MRGQKRKSPQESGLPLAKRRHVLVSRQTSLIPDIVQIILAYIPTFCGEVDWTRHIPEAYTLDNVQARYVQTRLHQWGSAEPLYDVDSGELAHHRKNIAGTVFGTWDVGWREDNVLSVSNQNDPSVCFSMIPCPWLFSVFVLRHNSIVCFGDNGVGSHLRVVYVSAKALWDWLQTDPAEKKCPFVEEHGHLLDPWAPSTCRDILASETCLLLQALDRSCVYNFAAVDEDRRLTQLPFTSRFRVTKFVALPSGAIVFVRQCPSSTSVLFNGKKRRLANTKALLVVAKDATIVLCDRQNKLTCRSLWSWKRVWQRQLPFDVFGLYELSKVDSIVAVSQQGDTWTFENGVRVSPSRTQLEDVHVRDGRALVFERAAATNDQKCIEQFS